MLLTGRNNKISVLSQNFVHPASIKNRKIASNFHVNSENKAKSLTTATDLLLGCSFLNCFSELEHKKTITKTSIARTQKKIKMK